MLKFCDLNKQVDHTKVSSCIHVRRYYTPQKNRSLETNRQLSKKISVPMKESKKADRGGFQFNIKGSSKSWASMEPVSSSSPVKDVKDCVSSQRGNVKRRNQSKSATRIERISSLLKDIRNKYGLLNSKMVLSSVCSKGTLCKSHRPREIIRDDDLG
jgi:hypothetical protein